MNSTAEKYEWTNESRYFGPAHILEFDEQQGLYKIQLSGVSDAPGKLWAASAVAGSYFLSPGDKVLCAAETLAEIYIIGVLKSVNPKISLSTGAYATLSGDAIQVFSNEKTLLFEYDAQCNCARITPSFGDLEVASQGNINFTAGQNIQFQGQHLEMKGRHGMRIGLQNTIGKLSNAITFSPGRIRLQSNELGVTAKRNIMQTEETRITSKRFKGVVEHAQIVGGTIETLANSVIEKAKNTYRSVEQLSQLTAGRMKTLVKTTIHTKSKQSFLHAEDDYKINADKIHLG